MSGHLTAALLRSTITGNDTFTKLLLHFDGADAATTALDYSPNQHTISFSGNAQIDTAQSAFGGASALFDGTGDYVSAPDHGDLELVSGDWAIDLRARFNVTPGSGTFYGIVAKWTSPNLSWFFGIENNSGTLRLVFLTSTDGTSSSSAINQNWTPSTGVWYHLAVTKSGTDLRFFVNGVQQGSAQTHSVTPFSGTSSVQIGAGGTNYFNGWLDEVRMSKGTARWTANFIPPAQPYG